MRLSSLHIFQTQDRTVVKNVLRDLSNGAVLVAGPNGGLTPLANEERNLTAFTSEEQRYGNQAKELTFSYDAVRGDSLPTSTPATNAVIQDRNVKSVYGVKRENLANMLRFFFTDLVIPQAIRELSKEHIMNFIGTPEEINKLDKTIADNLSFETAKNEILGGKVTNQESIKQELLTQLKEMGANRFIQIKEGYYKNADWTFDINIDNEQEDAQLINNNLFAILQTLSSNPGVLQDPVIKTLFYEYAEKSGVSPMKLEIASQQRQEMTQQAPQLPQGQMRGEPAKAIGQEEESIKPLK